MLNKDLYKYLKYFYILFLLFSFFYVKNVVNTERVIVSEEVKDTEKEREIKPITVYLEVNSTTKPTKYRVKMNNTNSLEDLLEELRKNNSITYEKNFYSEGARIYSVNGVSQTDSFSWEIYANDENVTKQLDDLELVDEYTYKLNYSPIRI